MKSHFIKLILVSVTAFSAFALSAKGKEPEVTATLKRNDALEQAIYERNFNKIFEIANQSAENETIAIDALCNEINLDDYSYEQLRSYDDIPKSETINKLFKSALSMKEVAILNELSTLTAEQFYNYSITFPKRKEILQQFFDEVVMPNAKNLSVQELIYYAENLPDSYQGTLMAEIDSRKEEIANVLKQKEGSYKHFELVLANRVKYLLETIIWTYYVEGHKQLNEAYSTIGIVADNPSVAASQYQSLVRACFPVHNIQNALQEEINKFYAELNRAREDYYKTAGSTTVPKLTYKVPLLNLNSNVSVDPLREIGAARARYVRNREDVSTGTSVIGFLFGTAAGLVAQGIGDWFAIDGLVDSEYNARKKYMESVQKRLITSFSDYSKTVLTGFDKTLR